MDALRSHVLPDVERFQKEPPFRIGGANVDPEIREIRIGDSRERIQPQPFRVLMLLHKHQGHLVTRDDIIEKCWDRRIVGDDVINRSILLLRRIANRAGGFRIETIPKAGYRLVENAVVGSRRPLPISRIALGAAALAAIGSAMVYSSWPKGPQPLPESPSVAIAPIATQSEPERDTAFDITSQLSRALSETGFAVGQAGERQPDLRIESDLRSSSAKVKLDLRVIDSKSGTVMLMRHFAADPSKASSLAPQIAADVATSLSWGGPYLALNPAERADPKLTAQLIEVLALHSEHRDYMRAFQISQRIAPKMPRSAIAQVAYAMGTAFVLAQLPRDAREKELIRARNAADQALRLRSNYGDSHLPWCVLHPKVWFVRCERKLLEGLNVESSAASIPGYLAGVLVETGRHDAALARLSQTYSSNPYKLGRIGGMLSLLGYSGQTAQAEQVYRRSRVYWPDHPELPIKYMNGLIAGDDLQRAKAFAQGREASDPEVDGARVGRIIDATERNDNKAVLVECGAPASPIIMQACIMALSRVGELDRAFALANGYLPTLKGPNSAAEEKMWLDQPRTPSIAFLSAPAFAALRRDPRFVALADRMGLLAVWRSGRMPDFCTRRHEPVCAAIQRR